VATSPLVTHRIHKTSFICVNDVKCNAMKWKIIAAKLLSYSAPTITQLIGCNSTAGSTISGCNRYGGDRLTLMYVVTLALNLNHSLCYVMYINSGVNFGPASPRVLIGVTECTNLVWSNDSFVTCDIPSGSGDDQSVLLLQLNGIFLFNTLCL
jgi:hypothetical protein